MNKILIATAFLAALAGSTLVRADWGTTNSSYEGRNNGGYDTSNVGGTTQGTTNARNSNQGNYNNSDAWTNGTTNSYGR